MSDPANRPDVPEELAAAENRDAASVAREQFVHGLLEMLHRDGADARERRIERLMARLEAPIPIAPPAPGAARRAWRFPRRLAAGMAAAAALVGVTLLGLPTERSAMAMVQDSLKASGTAGDRRYDVKIVPPKQVEGQLPTGRLDVRDREHVVLSMTSPMGDTVVRGRNGTEEWAVLPDGTVDRLPPRRVLPPWVDFGTSTVILASVDELLSTLEESYDLKRGVEEPLPSGGAGSATTAKYQRITAIHRGGSPEPNRVELWLDPQTKVVRRMELHWKPRPMQGGPDGPGGPGGRPGPEGGDRGPGPRGDLPPPEMGDGRGRRGPGPEGRPRRDGMGPGPEDGPPPEDGMPMRPRRDGPRHRPGPEGGPPPEDRMDGDGPGPEPRHRPGPPPPEGERRDGRPGDGPMGPDRGPRDGPGRGPRPRFLGDQPDFDKGHHPPPPRMLVFELVDGATFPQGWFDAAAHLQGSISAPR